MPELPEVETVLCGLRPHLEGAIVEAAIVRQFQLRWPVPKDLSLRLSKQKIIRLARRGKYLLIQLSQVNLIIHLGMSGSLRILPWNTAETRHDHLDIILSTNKLLRYTDPRRFGTILTTTTNPLQHRLLKDLGIEPFDAQFTGAYLRQAVLNRKAAIKTVIMNSKIVVGVGNIYATEALFLAQIHPLTPAKQLSERRCSHLVDAIKKILYAAILQGGTTLKDFVNSDGKPGYFTQKLKVYKRAGLPCDHCGHVLQLIQLQKRSTVFCGRCQSLGE